MSGKRRIIIRIKGEDPIKREKKTRKNTILDFKRVDYLTKKLLFILQLDKDTTTIIADYCGYDFPLSNLEGEKVNYTIAKDVDMEESNFTNVTFNYLMLTRALLNRSNLKECSINNISFYSVSLYNTGLYDVKGENNLFSKCNLSSSTIKDTSLVGSTFNNIEIEEIEILNTDFSNSTFVENRIEKCEFTNLIMNKTKLVKCILKKTTIIGGNFSKLKIDDCEIENLTISDINLSKVSISDFESGIMKWDNVNMSGSEIKNLSTDGSVFENVDLSDSVIKSFKFDSSILNKIKIGNTTFDRCYFEITELTSLVGENVKFTFCFMDVRIKFRRNNITKSIFTSCSFKDVKLKDNKLNNNIFIEGTKFQKCSLNGDDLSDCKIEETNFSRVELNGCEVENTTFNCCQFEKVEFNNINLIGSFFMKCSFTNITFDDCRMKDVTFQECTFEKLTMKKIESIPKMKSCIFKDKNPIEELKEGSSSEKYKPVESKTEEIDLDSIPDDISIYEVAKNYPPPGWKEHFKEKDSELKRVSTLIEKNKRDTGDEITPPNNCIFRAFHLTPLKAVRVVIIGQDPYPAPGVATGLAFSTHPCGGVPASLKNIYKEIANSCKGFTIPDNGCLDHWARQGVFLINTCLTCPVGKAGGHSKFNIWIPFISSVLKLIGETNKDCFYMLWGKPAQECKQYIKGKEDRILCTSHPSPLSASRGFNGCGHFALINKKLVPPIKW